MRIISKGRLRRFWEDPAHRDAEGPLRAWYTHVGNKSVAWQWWGAVKAKFGTASAVGNCVVFKIGGNKYRLVTRILYPSRLCPTTPFSCAESSSGRDETASRRDEIGLLGKATPAKKCSS